jgi:hypothetical protein
MLEEKRERTGSLDMIHTTSASTTVENSQDFSFPIFKRFQHFSYAVRCQNIVGPQNGLQMCKNIPGVSRSMLLDKKGSKAPLSSWNPLALILRTATFILRIHGLCNLMQCFAHYL